MPKRSVSSIQKSACHRYSLLLLLLHHPRTKFLLTLILTNYSLLYSSSISPVHPSPLQSPANDVGPADVIASISITAPKQSNPPSPSSPIHRPQLNPSDADSAVVIASFTATNQSSLASLVDMPERPADGLYKAARSIRMPKMHRIVQKVLRRSSTR